MGLRAKKCSSEIDEVNDLNAEHVKVFNFFMPDRRKSLLAQVEVARESQTKILDQDVLELECIYKVRGLSLLIKLRNFLRAVNMQSKYLTKEVTWK